MMQTTCSASCVVSGKLHLPTPASLKQRSFEGLYSDYKNGYKSVECSARKLSSELAYCKYFGNVCVCARAHPVHTRL